MSAAQPMYLLDTNVWLDYFLPGRPNSRAAFELVDALCQSSAEMLVAANSLKDLFYLSSLLLKRKFIGCGSPATGAAAAAQDAAWSLVETVTAVATTVGSDLSDVWVARKQRALHADFEDDLIIAAALRAQADYLVTEDAALLAHSPVATLCTKDALKLLEA